MTDCLFGVDLNRDALRVAAFSLNLTMCDYLEPRHIWSSVQFPKLQDKNLWENDFFDFIKSPPTPSIKADLVIGNPPWESKLSESATDFLSKHQRTVGDKQMAQAFLWAAPEVCKPEGSICLVAPSKGLLFNASGTNKEFRKQFFNSYSVNLIVNFSALRRTLFAKAVGPASPIVYRPISPENDHHVTYCCPKPCDSPEDYWHYVISDKDIQPIPLKIALNNPHVWKVAMWGGPRDWELITKLSRLCALEKYADNMKWIHSEGFIVGARNKKAPWLTGKPYVPVESLERFSIRENSLIPLEETLFERPRTEEAFMGPHILFGQGPKAKHGFVASLLRNYAVFRDAIVGISGPKLTGGCHGSCLCGPDD